MEARELLSIEQRLNCLNDRRKALEVQLKPILEELNTIKLAVSEIEKEFETLN